MTSKHLCLATAQVRQPQALQKETEDLPRVIAAELGRAPHAPAGPISGCRAFLPILAPAGRGGQLRPDSHPLKINDSWVSVTLLLMIWVRFVMAEV